MKGSIYTAESFQPTMIRMCSHALKKVMFSLFKFKKTENVVFGVVSETDI